MMISSVVIAMEMGSTATGVGVATSATGFGGASSFSSHSAVILSSVLDATLALAMPSSLALVKTTLFSKPSFFAIS